MVEKDHPNILFYKTSFAQNEFAEAEISSHRKKIDMGAKKRTQKKMESVKLRRKDCFLL